MHNYHRPISTRSSIRSILLPSVIGNLLEWYDFTLYGYFATIFAANYFPHHEKALSLIEAYAVFAVSYCMRPLGALLFGYIGDCYGRKLSLTYSILLMGACSIAVCVLPTYADWGAMAGIVLAFIRLLQGIAIGGEYSGASIYLIESAPAKQRSFFGSLAVSSAYFGFLLSSGVGAFLSAIFSPSDLATWGWRFGFAFGGVIALVGFYMRQKLQETPVFQLTAEHQQKSINPLKSLIIEHPKTLLLAIGIAVLPAGFVYTIFVYLTNFLSENMRFSTHDVLVINIWSMCLMVITMPCVGWLADRFGRRFIMLSAAAFILVLCVPLFKLLVYHVLLTFLLFALLNACYEANIPSELAEIFPSQYRFTGLALAINIAFGVVGGLSPLVSSFLAYQTHLAAAPMFFVIGLSIISIICLTIAIKYMPPKKSSV